MSKYEHFCTNCGSTLENQEGYSSRKKAWKCTECGTALYGKEDNKRKYKGIVWFCDGCGEILDNQRGFTDKKGTWKCRECGYENIINESNIIDKEKPKTSKKKTNKKKTTNSKKKKEETLFDNELEEDSFNSYESDINTIDDLDEEEEDDDDEDEYDLNYDDVLDYDYLDDTSYEEYEQILEERKKKKEILEKINHEEERISNLHRKAWLRKNGRKVFRSTIITILVIVLIYSLLILFLFLNSLIKVGYDSKDLVGLKYTVVEDKLESHGFTNVNTKNIKDLKLKNRNKSGIVTEVIIGKKNKFNSRSKFLPDTEITIIYHTTIKYNPPITSKDAKGKQYSEIVELFKKAGFTNVKVKGMDDLVTGWINKEGEVSSITINSEKNYYEDDEFEQDASVIIKYHSFK